MFENLKEDIVVFVDQEFGITARNIYVNIFKLLFCQGFIAVIVYRFGAWIYSKNTFLVYPIKVLYFFLNKIVEITAGIMLPPSAKIGKGFYIGHFGYVIINDSVDLLSIST